MGASIEWSMFADLPVPAAFVERAEEGGWQVHRNAAMTRLLGPRSDDLALEWAHGEASDSPVSVRVRDPEGVCREVEVHWSRARGGVLVIVDDATAASLAEARRHLSSLVGHHLRTPLTPIVGFVKLVQRRAQALGDPELLDYTLVLERNTARLVRTVTRVAELESLSGHPATELRPLELENVIVRAAATAGMNGDVALEVMDGKTHVAKGDALHTERALAEILHNAGRHGQRPIRIRLATVDGAIVVRVRDAGPGLPQHLDPIGVFEPYVQAAGDNHAPTGEGLGLPLARAHCRAMGADVSYAPDSREFVLTLGAWT